MSHMFNTTQHAWLISHQNVILVRSLAANEVDSLRHACLFLVILCRAQCPKGEWGNQLKKVILVL